MTHNEDIITAAIRAETVVQFDYPVSKRRGRMHVNTTHVRRTLSPYSLAEDGETVLGFDHGRQALRRFELSKISGDVAVANEDYIKPIDQEDI